VQKKKLSSTADLVAGVFVADAQKHAYKSSKEFSPQG
jgi:hypothetical protein